MGSPCLRGRGEVQTGRLYSEEARRGIFSTKNYSKAIQAIRTSGLAPPIWGVVCASGSIRCLLWLVKAGGKLRRGCLASLRYAERTSSPRTIPGCLLFTTSECCSHQSRRLPRLSSGPTEATALAPLGGGRPIRCGEYRQPSGLVITHRFPDLEFITPVDVAASCYKASVLFCLVLIPFFLSTHPQPPTIPQKPPFLLLCLQSEFCLSAPPTRSRAYSVLP